MLLEPATEAWELEEADRRRRGLMSLVAVPGLAELFRVHPGDRVQVLLSFRGRDKHGPFLQCEKHWLEVRRASDDGGDGALDKNPRCSSLLHAGDTVAFEMRHISAIERKTKPTRRSPSATTVISGGKAGR